MAPKKPRKGSAEKVPTPKLPSKLANPVLHQTSQSDNISVVSSVLRQGATTVLGTSVPTPTRHAPLGFLADMLELRHSRDELLNELTPQAAQITQAPPLRPDTTPSITSENTPKSESFTPPLVPPRQDFVASTKVDKHPPASTMVKKMPLPLVTAQSSSKRERTSLGAGSTAKDARTENNNNASRKKVSPSAEDVSCVSSSSSYTSEDSDDDTETSSTTQSDDSRRKKPKKQAVGKKADKVPKAPKAKKEGPKRLPKKVPLANKNPAPSGPSIMHQLLTAAAGRQNAVITIDAEVSTNPVSASAYPVPPHKSEKRQRVEFSRMVGMLNPYLVLTDLAEKYEKGGSKYRWPSEAQTILGQINQFNRNSAYPPLLSDCCETFATLGVVILLFAQTCHRLETLWTTIFLTNFLYVASWAHQLTSPAWKRGEEAIQAWEREHRSPKAPVWLSSAGQSGNSQVSSQRPLSQEKTPEKSAEEVSDDSDVEIVEVAPKPAAAVAQPAVKRIVMPPKVNGKKASPPSLTLQPLIPATLHTTTSAPTELVPQIFQTKCNVENQRPKVNDIRRCLNLDEVFNDVKLHPDDFHCVYFNERDKAEKHIRTLVSVSREKANSVQHGASHHHPRTAGYVIASKEFTYSVAALPYVYALPARSIPESKMQIPVPEALRHSGGPFGWRLILLDSHGTLPWMHNAGFFSVSVPSAAVERWWQLVVTATFGDQAQQKDGECMLPDDVTARSYLDKLFSLSEIQEAADRLASLITQKFDSLEKFLVVTKTDQIFQTPGFPVSTFHPPSPGSLLDQLRVARDKKIPVKSDFLPPLWLHPRLREELENFAPWASYYLKKIPSRTCGLGHFENVLFSLLDQSRSPLLQNLRLKTLAKWKTLRSLSFTKELAEAKALNDANHIVVDGFVPTQEKPVESLPHSCEHQTAIQDAVVAAKELPLAEIEILRASAENDVSVPYTTWCPLSVATPSHSTIELETSARLVKEGYERLKQDNALFGKKLEEVLNRSFIRGILQKHAAARVELEHSVRSSEKEQLKENAILRGDEHSDDWRFSLRDCWFLKSEADLGDNS